MAVTYTLGKDYTVSGLEGVTDLTLTLSGERIDITTRAGALPIKKTVASFPDKTFECTVLAEADTSFSVGKSYSCTINGEALSLICMQANREEPQEGIVTYKLTLKPGQESEVANQIVIGPGDFRS
jgi:hypothetical protein